MFRLANSSRAERIRRPQRRMVMTQGRINVFRDDVVVQPVPSREARAISIVEESSNRHELVSARGTLRNISCITLFLQTTYRDSQTNHPLTCSNAFSHPSSFSVLTSRPVRRWTSRKLSTFSPSSCPLKCGYSIRSSALHPVDSQGGSTYLHRIEDPHPKSTASKPQPSHIPISVAPPREYPQRIG